MHNLRKRTLCDVHTRQDIDSVGNCQKVNVSIIVIIANKYSSKSIFKSKTIQKRQYKKTEPNKPDQDRYSNVHINLLIWQ